jgi:hypothetical protein
MGIVVSGLDGDWGYLGCVAFCALGASGDVSVLGGFGVCVSRSVKAFGAVSSSARLFVLCVPFGFVSPQLSGCDMTMRFCVVRSVVRVSISRGKGGVVDEVCTTGCVGVGYRDG